MTDRYEPSARPVVTVNGLGHQHNLVDDGTEKLVINRFGPIIRIDNRSLSSVSRSTSGVRLLTLCDLRLFIVS